ncbi:MarC family protein [Marinobacter sp. Hex_13]|uniref:MarC family protein n=1 Tax=Marinobacter sp. Hex_13 TaxID=1795866 RepID=UPI0007991E90|nr:MarC family protein [Marinobacter sp. Hex_13]KXJ47754.1 MAG: antibiotic resistance protein MarC [Marinobacter sp. Hex_13]
MDKTELIKAFGAFFAIMNPFVNLPIFLALTTGFTVAQQRTLAVKIVLFSALMCGVILLAGQAIIHFFGITVDQFRVAGGIVLAHIAWSMLNGDNISSHHGSDAEQGQMQDLSGLAFYPITFPMIVGPGTIATLIIYAGHAGSAAALLALSSVVAAILLMLFAVLFFASAFGKVLSDTMRVITTRLMGMILLAIAVSMLVAGLSSLFPGLAGTS